jgi:hypothetical protein
VVWGLAGARPEQTRARFLRNRCLLSAIAGELTIAAACTFIPPLPSLLAADGLRRYLIRRGSRSAVTGGRLAAIRGLVGGPRYSTDEQAAAASDRSSAATIAR